MKYALVTGSTKGIGKSIGIKLLECGYYVFFNYFKDFQEANKLNDQLEQKYQNQYSIVKADLSDVEGIDDLVSAIYEKTQMIDVIVLNAGTTSRKPLKEMNIQEWNRVMDVNLNMPFYLIKKLYDSINKNGRIIFIGSVLGKYPHASSIPYGVSKAGVNALAKALVKEFEDRLITVNCVMPGFVETQWQKNKPLDQRERIEDKIALHRFAMPEEIAELCVHIISNAYINGAEIQIDGGYCYK